MSEHDPSGDDIVPDEDRDYVTDEDLAMLKAETDIMGEDEATMANKVFRLHLPEAALSIVKLARNAASDRTRLDAAKYIVERNLGRLQDINPNAAKDPLAVFFEEVEEAANEAS